MISTVSFDTYNMYIIKVYCNTGRDHEFSNRDINVVSCWFFLVICLNIRGKMLRIVKSYRIRCLLLKRRLRHMTLKHARILTSLEKIKLTKFIWLSYQKYATNHVLYVEKKGPLCPNFVHSRFVNHDFLSVNLAKCIVTENFLLLFLVCICCIHLNR